MEQNKFIDLLFALAKKEGFSACEVYQNQAESFSVSVYEGEIDEYNVCNEGGLSFRGLYGDKMGYASTQVMDEDAIKMLVLSAKENAQLIENPDKQFIYPGSETYESVQGIYQEELDRMPERDKIAFALAMEKASLAQGALKISHNAVGTSSGSVLLCNNLGLRLEKRSNLSFAYVSPILPDQDNQMQDGLAYYAGRELQKQDPSSIATRALADARSRLGSESVPSGSYDILFKNEAMTDLIGHFSGIFSADAAQKGLSLLKGKEGTSIAANCITLRDDPLLPGGFASRSFDGEGVATKNKSVIENGRLVTLLHNLKTAYKQGVTTTGNAGRGSYSSPVGIALSNFYIEKGKEDLPTMFKRLNKGLYITFLSGLHAGANPISGDFSLLARGFLVENGQKIRPVNQITLAGNYYDLLRSCEAVGSDLFFAIPSGSASIGSPSFLVRGMKVAGK